MKKKTSKILALLSLSLVCSAFAVVNVAVVEKASANTVSVFAMKEGASIRVADDPGIRFTVKLDETLKTKVENNTVTLGFVASYADYFEGKTEDYLNTVTTKLNPELTTIAAEKIYEENGEYLANLAIVGESVKQDLTKDWAAIAYYTENGVTTYAGEVQTRSIQLVASRLYFDSEETAKWEAVKTVYTTLGTQEMPILVENGENGEINSYQSLFLKRSDVGDLKFKMTEDVVAEGTVEDPDVVVNASEFAVTSPEGLIWDNTNACTDFVWMAGDNGDTTGFEVSYDKNAKFNGVGNGAVKMTVDLTSVSESGNGNVSFSFASRFSKEYYKELYDAGYTHITARYMIPSYGTVQMPASILNEMGVACDTVEALVTHIYADGTTDAWYQWFENGAPHMDKWLELSSPIKVGFDGLTSFDLFKLNVPTAGKKLTIYVDNIYMTKSAGGGETEQKDAGTVVDVKTDCGFALDGAYNAIENYTKDGEAVLATDNKVTLEEGMYEFTFRADNRFGIAKKVYEASVVIEEKQVLWNISNDTALSNISTSVLYANDGSGEYAGQTATLTYRSDLGCAQLVHSTDYSYSDLIVKPTQSKAYYEKLKSLGYKYVTVSFKFYGGEFKIAAGGSEGGEMTHRNNIYVGNTGLVTVVKNQDGSLTETDFAGAGTWTTNATPFTVSYSIDLFINNYNANGMKILRLMTMYGAGAGVFGNYDFAEIQFTKDGQMMS